MASKSKKAVNQAEAETQAQELPSSIPVQESAEVETSSEDPDEVLLLMTAVATFHHKSRINSWEVPGSAVIPAEHIIRTTAPVINAVGEVEEIYDGGFQVVSGAMRYFIKPSAVLGYATKEVNG